MSVISQYVGLHFRKVYEQGCDLQMVSATSPTGQWMLKEIFRYITREGGRVCRRRVCGPPPRNDPLIFDVPTIILCRAAELPPRRRVPAEVEARREALLDIIDDGKPMTVRQVFYQATVRSLVEKAETGYSKVQTDLTLMRRSGELPYDWLADNTRWQRKPRTFNGVAEALQHTAEFYRKDLWANADCYAEIWLEKDALAGVVYPVTSQFDVPLMVARGYASLSFLHTAAEYISTLDVPTYIYHLGDFDPSGVNAGEKIEETLRELAPDAEIYFERLAVTPEQIDVWELPTRPTKKKDTRAKKFGSATSVELDAIEPNQLRDLVQVAIEQHLPTRQFEVLKAAEESERNIISRLVRNATKSAARP